ncbi:MAG: hypothetical protein IKG59_03190 [Firmicutes bacterium]|nr:hypothetical protein [Bacillota bacterium]
MEINKNYEQEIDLKDLFFHLLYRWRSLLVAALIGAILLGAYQYLSIELTHREGKRTKAEKQYAVELQEFRDKIKNARESVKTYTNLINEKNAYLDESVYMKLDAQKEWYAFKTYSIRVDQAVLDALPQGLQEDPADRVAAVYVSTLKNGLDAEEMEALLGTGRREFIDELVGVGSDSSANTITIWVIGNSEEDVVRQLAYFDDRINTVCAPKAQAVEAHTLTPMDEDVRKRIDENLTATQNSINQQLIEWQKALKAEQEALNDIEDKKEPVYSNHIKLYVAIGFILGAFLLAAIYAVKYVMEGKLRSSGELSERFGLSVYGEYIHSRARHPGKGLDKLFEKWEFSHASRDEAVTAEIVALLGKQHNGKRVLLTGTASADKLLKLVQRLQPKLEGAVKLDAEGDLLDNQAALSGASQADAVVLVEEKHVSRTRSIEREAELLNMSSSKVGGCIVI